MSTQFILVRHGHVEGIHPPRFRGRREIPLTKLGLRQAEATARHLQRRPDVRAIRCSPRGRCVATAGIIGQALGIRQGQTHEEVRARDPQAFAAWRATPAETRFPQGESLMEVAARAVRALETACDSAEGGTTLLVSHDSVNRLMLLHMLGLPANRYWHIKQDPCAASLATREADGWIIGSMNETAHLDD